ncbi:conserved hypothetical protein [Cyanobium sp. PCC 7001]|uniref:DUF2518 family protein n=1 Tax=Cyanobium sp. PCC 7001 TaxID=180281 RepID=UPI0001804D9E|nr:DUF2518 family protein [Cyanobium sp. PCC 7001]EDY39645.1 conserved hypothetical protein [Cyanobium sp. PCC 7001]
MPTDPILFSAGEWLGAASGLLAIATIAGFLLRWGIRFRLVGITSFTALLALSCLAFAVSYRPRVSVEGAMSVPVVFDNGGDLVIAAAAADFPAGAEAATVEQVARNLRGSGRNTSEGLVTVRLRRVEPLGPGLSAPKVLAEAHRDLRDGSVVVTPSGQP